MTPKDNPPAYEYSHTVEGDALPPKDVKQLPGPTHPHTMGSHQSYPSPTVHHYINPRTHEHVASLLPPDHPEMVCLQAGGHVKVTRFGLLGILAAILWFPLGVGVCLLDRRVKCARCGLLIRDSICG